MGIIKGLSRLGVLLASLGVIAVSFAGTAPASLAMVRRPDGVGGADGTGFGGPAPVIHTVVVGGMPGWQIAVIAIVAALVAAVVAAVAAVLLERTRTARRRLLSTAA